MNNFGDRLYELISESGDSLFDQGEMFQFSIIAYKSYITRIEKMKKDVLEISYPVGLSPDKKIITTTEEYTRSELLKNYEDLKSKSLPTNGIFQLVTIIESLLVSILRDILMKFPNKISNSRKLNAEVVLNASSLEEIRLSIINSILNELTYKSPKEFGDDFNKYSGVNLLENPVYHKYMELKATRDIHLHNSGITNRIYMVKAGTLARVESDQYLPVTIQYYLESYESCIRLTEILAKEFNDIWPSPLYEKEEKHLSSMKVTD